MKWSQGLVHCYLPISCIIVGPLICQGNAKDHGMKWWNLSAYICMVWVRPDWSGSPDHGFCFPRSCWQYHAASYLWCALCRFPIKKKVRGWDDLGEWHWNMNNIIYETSRQSRFDERYWLLGAGALGWLRGMVQGGRKEEGSRWGTHVYLWQIHADIWQNQYDIVKLKNKIKLKKRKWKNFR